MSKIEIEIKNCSECPFIEQERVYTGDSFEIVYKWLCTRKKNKVITGSHEVFDKAPEIPKWCPVLVKES